MPGLLRIGLTTRPVIERVAELNSATGVPAPFSIEAFFESSDPNAHESVIHQRLRKHRVPNREFFKIDLKEAIDVARAVMGCEPTGSAEKTVRRDPHERWIPITTRGGTLTHR
jgi:hypothetical protein